MFKIIDQIPWAPLIIITLMLGLAPFSPEPHLVEKSRMLLQGLLHKPVDIFDLVMHAAPFLIVLLKLTSLVLYAADK